MTKFITTIIFALFVAIFPVLAATTDFTANGNITVDGVTFGTGTADLLILNTSTAESWAFNSGAFTVTNPGIFKIGSSDSSVKSIKATCGGSDVACAENTTPGTSHLTLPTTAGTYTIIPLTTTDCTSLCSRISHTATYNSFPTCGAASCESGYSLSGTGASAICIASTSGSVNNTVTYCSSVEYGDWKTTCVNNFQYRDITSKYPNYCTLTSSQENARKRACNIEKPTTTVEKPIITVTKTIPGVPATNKAGRITYRQMFIDAKTIASGDVNKVVVKMGVKRVLSSEINYNRTIVAKIVKNSNVTAQIRNTIISFVTYGTPATKVLGAGERAGVVNSYKTAFNRLPMTVKQWFDAIKIANGRFPLEQSISAEKIALKSFTKVYKRLPVFSNNNDEAAVKIMSYGLIPDNRNLNSEKAAIRIFNAIYKYNPFSATDWDIVRAIAYSGATR